MAWLPAGRRSAFEQLVAGVPAGHWAHRPFRWLADAALEVRLHPADLVADHYPGSQLQLLAGGRGWADATVCLYAKAARAHGLAVPWVPTPEPARGPSALPELYVHTDRQPAAVVRAALWCRLATRWPAPLPAWSDLARAAATFDGGDVLLCPDPARPLVRVEGAAPLLAAWWGCAPASDTLLCTLRAGPYGVRGGPMAPRTLEHAFRLHCRRAATLAAETAAASGDPAHRERARLYLELTYDRYRRLLLAAGAPAPLPYRRGLVRAGR